MTDTEPISTGAAQPSSAETSGGAVGRRRRRRLSRSTKRVLLTAAGLLLAAGSVTGFLLAAEALDERVPVLVAAADIKAGDTIAAADLTSTLAHPGSIPHIAWTPDAPFAFDGLIAAQPILAGALVDYSMMLAPGQAPVGTELTLLMPLDTSLAPDGVFDGERVLLIDPGAEPTGVEGEDGRPRQVLREFDVTNFDGTQMRLYLDPDQWSHWRAELDDAGGVFQVLPVPLGGDVAELGAQLNDIWEQQWAEAVNAAAAAREALRPPEAPPGTLEVVVRLNESLVPSGIADGDRVLVIDPGQTPRDEDLGRARSVLTSVEVINYDNGTIRLFVAPEEWVWWSSLPETLGEAPLVIPVAPSTDVMDLTERLNLEWLIEWETKIFELDDPQAFDS